MVDITKNRLIRVINHGTEIGSIRWAPDGKRLVIGDEKGRVTVLNVMGQQLWQKTEQTSIVWGIDWSPDGNYIAVSNHRKQQTVVYKADTGAILFNIPANQSFSVRWSPDSRYLAHTPDRKIGIIDVKTQQTILESPTYQGALLSITWSPDGKRIACGSLDSTARIWDSQSMTLQYCMTNSGGSTFIACWSFDGQILVSGNGKNICIWNSTTGQCSQELDGQKGIIESLVCSPIGSIFATGSCEQIVRIWDADKGIQLVELVGHKTNARHVAFSHDGLTLASGSNNGEIMLWDVSDLAPSPSHLSTQTLATGLLVNYLSRQAATVGIHAFQTVQTRWTPYFPESDSYFLGKLDYQRNNESCLVGIAISPCSQTIMIGRANGQIQAWNLINHSQHWIVQNIESHVNEIAISKDGRRLAVGQRNGNIFIFDASKGQLLANCIGHEKAIMQIQWSLDGQRLASIDFSSGNSIRIWNTVTGNCLFEFGSHLTLTQCLNWSPDGKFLASGDNSGNLYLWDVQTNTILNQIKFGACSIWGLIWLSDSRKILLSFMNGILAIVDPFSRSPEFSQYLLEDTGFGEGATGLSLSPDGKLLAVATRSSNKIIYIWNTESWQQLYQLQYQGEKCYRLVWAANGCYLATSHADGSVHFWDVCSFSAFHKPLQDKTSSQPLSLTLRILPSALSQLNSLGLFAPLSWVQTLLSATGTNPTTEPSLEPSLQRLLAPFQSLQWQPTARISLVAFLLHQLTPDGRWIPPAGITSSQLQAALLMALGGESIPAEASPLPISLLQSTANLIDDRLLTLLNLLGEDAVAVDPGLPLKLLPILSKIPALSQKQRQLLGLKVQFSGSSGRSIGASPTADRAQIGGIETGRRIDWQALLPSQFALPSNLFAYRFERGELLYRSRNVSEPSQLRPIVLLLDISPACSPIERFTRLAAFTIARTLYEAQIPVVLVTSGGQEQIVPIETRAELVEIWTQRTLKMAHCERSLKLSQTIRSSLRTDNCLEPIVLLLSHPWFGCDDNIQTTSHLRGLFVQYPKHDVTPALASLCDRWQSLSPDRIADLETIVGDLIG